MDFTFTDEQKHLRKNRPRIRRGRNRSARHGVGRSLAFPSRTHPQTRGNGPARRHFPGKIWRRRPRLRGIRHRSSKNFRAWTAPSASSSPRTIRSAPITSTNSAPRSKSGNISSRSRREKSSAPGRSPNPKPAPTQAARAPTARAQRCALDAQRRENLHHQRPLCGHLRGHGRHRQIAKARTASARSSWKRACPVFAPAKKKTSWACAPATPPKSFSPIAAFRVKICSAQKAKVSRAA